MTRILRNIPLLLLAAMLCMPSVSYAQAKASKLPYTQVVLDSELGDKDAIEIVKKLQKKDLEKMQDTNNIVPLVSAQFIALGPDQPKTTIMAKITHSMWCGSSGCLIQVFVPTGKKNGYRKAFETTSFMMFQNLRPGQKYYDLLAFVGPRKVDGFGVYFWNEKTSAYDFGGISRFTK